MSAAKSGAVVVNDVVHSPRENVESPIAAATAAAAAVALITTTTSTTQKRQVTARRRVPDRLGRIRFTESRFRLGGSVAEWIACWTQAQKGPGSNCSRDAVG